MTARLRMTAKILCRAVAGGIGLALGIRFQLQLTGQRPMRPIANMG